MSVCYVMILSFSVSIPIGSQQQYCFDGLGDENHLTCCSDSSFHPYSCGLQLLSKRTTRTPVLRDVGDKDWISSLDDNRRQCGDNRQQITSSVHPLSIIYCLYCSSLQLFTPHTNISSK